MRQIQTKLGTVLKVRKVFTIDDVLNSACGALNDHLKAPAPDKPKAQKYKNVIVEFDGYIFRSKKELGRYVTLRAKQTAGEITDLQLQVPFELNEGGTHSLKYVADFLYRDLAGQYIIEDSKGKETKLFLKKQKLMLALHGIIIKKT